MPELSRFAWLIVLVIAVVVLGGCSTTQPSRPPSDDFPDFLDRADAAQRALQNGEADAYKALWHHGEDVTLSGGFGGTIERGWPAISSRLDWVASQFSKGSNTIERVASGWSGDLGYVVQAEHITFQVPGQTALTTRDYRVTMLFRRVGGQWRIIHRQADSQVAKQAPGR